MQKFDRYFELEIWLGEYDFTRSVKPISKDEKITIKYPNSIEFSISRNMYSQGNTSNFKLYNLSVDVMSKIWKDENDGKKFNFIRFYAGYGDEIALVFAGRMTSCMSYRKGGDTEYVTEIEADDYMWNIYGFSSVTIGAGSNFTSIMNEVLKQAQVYELGVISPDIPKIKANRNFTGRTIDLLREEYGSKFDIFVDKGVIHALKPNEVVPSEIPVISRETGLLGTPEKRGSTLILNTIFEPRLSLAQAVAVYSYSLPFLNNTYKVSQIIHQGTISPSICGQVTTKVVCNLVGNTLIELEPDTKTYEGSTTRKADFKRPVATQYRVTSPFGDRNSVKGSNKHGGIDYGCPKNTPVYAAANGTVTLRRTARGGKELVINHGKIEGKEVTSYYLHLNSYVATSGEKVSKGQVVAYSGNSGTAKDGSSYGPHLHFTIHENNNQVDPALYVGKN